LHIRLYHRPGVKANDIGLRTLPPRNGLYVSSLAVWYQKTLRQGSPYFFYSAFSSQLYSKSGQRCRAPRRIGSDAVRSGTRWRTVLRTGRRDHCYCAFGVKTERRNRCRQWVDVREVADQEKRKRTLGKAEGRGFPVDRQLDRARQTRDALCDGRWSIKQPGVAKSVINDF
jgi:hypothetical protein